jgi:hypothetical protein
MNKRIRTGLISTALVAGSLFGASAVSAQVDDTVTPDTAVEQPADVDHVDIETGDRGPRGDREERGDRQGRGDRQENRADRAQATADLLGIDAEELRAAYQEGQTLAQLAEANGVDVQTIIDAKVSAKTERINAAVEAGRLTAAEADEKLADLEAQVTTRVNEGGPVRGADGEHPARGERGERPARDGAPAADQDV